MKQISLVLFTIIFLNTLSFAQDSSNSLKAKNHISIDPLSPIFGTFQAQYERQIANHWSIGLNVGIKFSSIIKVSGIDGNKIKSEEFNFTGYKFIPEIRWYFQKNQTGLMGFYAGAYFKYLKVTDDFAGVYTDDNLENHDFLFDTNVQSFGGGIEIGYKLQVKKRFFIDFLISGPGIAVYTYSLKEAIPVPEAFFDDLAEVLSDYGILEHMDSDIEFSNQSGKVTLPAYRVAIKIGYTF